jgi:hypothetical protein
MPQHRRQVAVAAAIALACTTAPSRDVRDATDVRWAPDGFPAESTDLAALRAAFADTAPHHTNRKLSPLQAWRADGDGTWTPIAIDSIDPASTAAVVVGATLNCFFHESLAELSAARRVWYLFLGGRLVAYDHFDCTGDPTDMLSERFARVSPRDEETERTAITLLGRPPESDYAWSWGCPSRENYERGFAYLQSGRSADATRMLQAGDEAKKLTDRPRRTHCTEPAAKARARLAEQISEAGSN